MSHISPALYHHPRPSGLINLSDYPVCRRLLWLRAKVDNNINILRQFDDYLRTSSFEDPCLMKQRTCHPTNKILAIDNKLVEKIPTFFVLTFSFFSPF